MTARAAPLKMLSLMAAHETVLRTAPGFSFWGYVCTPSVRDAVGSQLTDQAEDTEGVEPGSAAAHRVNTQPLVGPR